MKKPINIEWWYKTRLCGVPQNFKELLADLFRKLATAIDNRTTISIEMKSLPVVSGSAKRRCIELGFKYAENLFIEEIKQEVYESGMKETMPELFPEEK